ncbi:MAG TPA: FAD-dependent oxidoreductase, partial [Clostridia bacterium]|nr:FAD-dependent oxidoreductase [Clostridia bacterium]
LYLERVVEKMKTNENFTLHLNKEVTTEDLKKEKYDVIITANGAQQTRPSDNIIPGIGGDNVLLAVDVLKNPELVKDGAKIVIIGGGEVGAEVAYMLNYEYGKDCKVVEMQKYIMNHVCTANRGHIIHYLEKGGVELLNCTKLVRIEGNKVYLSTNVHHSKPDPYNTWSPILPENIENPLEMLKPYREKNVERVLDADFVILALGSKSRNYLYFDLVKENAAAEIYNVGDSFKSANVWNAVRSAYRKARNI